MNWIPIFLPVELGSLVGFRIPCAVFWIPKACIPDSTTQISPILESGFLYMGGQHILILLI